MPLSFSLFLSVRMTELKMRHFIDANKTLTFFVILAIIFQFEAYEVVLLHMPPVGVCFLI
jgi:hypothetical protein